MIFLVRAVMCDFAGLLCVFVAFFGLDWTYLCISNFFMFLGIGMLLVLFKGDYYARFLFLCCEV